MHFDLQDLRLFVRVAESGSLTRAASLQHASLAAVSARIKALEEQVGMDLLVRQARGVKLTPPGEAFLHHARVMLRQLESMRSDLQEYGGGLRGHLRVHANTTAVSDILPDMLADYLSEHPRVNVDLQEKPNAEIARGVLDGRCDLGIVAGQVDALGLQALHFSTDRLVLAASRRHPLARRKAVSFAEVINEDMVGMHQGSTLQNFLEGEAHRLGKSLKLRIQLSSFDAMCRMIGAGVCVGVVPESTALRNQDSLRIALVRLTDPWSVRERHILVRDRASLPGYAQDLITALERRYQNS